MHLTSEPATVALLALDCAADAVLWVDREGRIAYANRSATRILGWPAEELSGMFLSAIDPACPAGEAPPWWDTLRDRGPLTFSGQLRRRDGTVFSVETAANRLEPDGEALACLAVRPVAPRGEGYEKTSLLAFLPKMIAVHQDERWVYINPAGLRLLGAEREEEILGTSIWDIVPETLQDTIRSRVEYVRTAGLTTAEIEQRFIRRDGSQVDVRVAGAPLIHEGRPAVVVFAEDITERKQAEEKLQTYRQRLEERVLERTRDLTAAGAQLAREVERRREAQEELVKFLALAENSSDFIGIADEQGSVQYLNPGARRLVGLTGEVPGEKWTVPDFVPKGLLPLMHNVLEGAARVGRWIGEGSLRDFNSDASIPVSMEVFTIRHPETGKPLGRGTIMRDIRRMKDYEERLRESEERARALMNAITETAFLIRPDGTFLAANETTARRLNRPLDQVIGRNVLEFMTPEVANNRHRYVASVLEYRRPARFVDQRDNRIYDQVVYPVFGSKDTVTALAIFARDITVERRSEEAYHAVVEHSFQGLAIIQDGSVVFANQALADILGQPLDSISGMKRERLAACFHPDDRQALLARYGREGGGPIEPAVSDFRIPRSDGSMVWVKSFCRAIEYGGRPALQEALLDITAARKADEQLAERTRELERSNAELEQFAYVASHDLQEPLRKISSFTSLLAREYQGRLGPEADEYIGFVTDGAARMQRLIEDLLAYSRMGRAALDRAALDLSRVVGDTVSDLEEQLTRTGARVTWHTLPTVHAHEGMMRQLFQNLLINAIKFRSAAPPEIRLDAERRNNEWVIAVRDNGIGIDPLFNERIFQIFQRLHTREEYPGTGIGLALCQRIVQRHGGRIWVESAPGRGAAFHFTLPAPPASATEDRQASPIGEQK